MTFDGATGKIHAAGGGAASGRECGGWIKSASKAATRSGHQSCRRCLSMRRMAFGTSDGVSGNNGTDISKGLASRHRDMGWHHRRIYLDGVSGLRMGAGRLTTPSRCAYLRIHARGTGPSPRSPSTRPPLSRRAAHYALRTATGPALALFLPDEALMRGIRTDSR